MDNGEITVIGGPASPEFARLLAKNLSLPLAEGNVTYFPDDEWKIRITGDIRTKSVLLVQSLHPPADRHGMQLYMMAKDLALKGRDVHVAMPYFGFSRQDKELPPGEIASFFRIGNLLLDSGVKSVAAVDIHSTTSLDAFPVPLYNIPAAQLLAKHIADSCKLQNPVIVSPDEGGKQRAAAFATTLGTDHIVFNKARDRVTNDIKMEDPAANFNGRDAIVVDDMIARGSTAIRATEILRKNNAGKIIVVCTHGLFLGDALEKIRSAGADQIVAANTVEGRPSNAVDVSALFAPYLKKISSEKIQEATPRFSKYFS